MAITIPQEVLAKSECAREIALVSVAFVSGYHLCLKTSKEVRGLFKAIKFPGDIWHQWYPTSECVLEILIPLDEECIWIPQFRKHRLVTDVSHRETYLGFLENGCLLVSPIPTIIC
ncbi:MAG: hypothetical protein A3E02_02335 [Candidatus Zambryskibacteria bacterium RIFCSPHIGHO2_12_FULL_38_34]|nr:MAG: hypothetical protein A3D37_00565 [Candidatus Zambryskibacteria bacterium RIFCSPHIGHO2_02_FULL_38_22]OHA97830.1 MAG: hypothetical protein A3E02_02335 [Candidatus Zambryskibacteria bacterium RIFCSPHIGHO2_12_FULL_38_34]